VTGAGEPHSFFIPEPATPRTLQIAFRLAAGNTEAVDLTLF
jgi:hypothetical protein